MSNFESENSMLCKNCMSCDNNIVKHDTCHDIMINNRFCRDCAKKDFDVNKTYCYCCLDVISEPLIKKQFNTCEICENEALYYFNKD